MELKITALPKERWKDYPLPIGYTTDEYYDVTIDAADGFAVRFTKKHCTSPITHTPEEYDFPDRLYEDHWEGAYAWGILSGDGRLLGAIETCPEAWWNRLRVTELWVDESIRRQGWGRRLMDVAKEQARLERRRAIILETQSCNANAIDFYRSQGFTLIGFDSCCYANNDVARREVRTELGILLDKPEKLSAEQVEIRPERPEDYFETECMVRRAFWNKYRPGCDEHYLVHILREDSAYLPELSRVAVVDGKVVGCILYSRSRVEEREVVTFGPLCVDPAYQGRGVGGMLMDVTLALAKEAGWSGVVIFGEPDYYPLHGFVTCDRFGITTADGGNSDSFMAYRLNDSFDGIHGRFHEAEVFEHLEGAAAYETKFPPMERQRFPQQWPDEKA